MLRIQAAGHGGPLPGCSGRARNMTSPFDVDEWLGGVALLPSGRELTLKDSIKVALSKGFKSDVWTADDVPEEDATFIT